MFKSKTKKYSQLFKKFVIPSKILAANDQTVIFLTVDGKLKRIKVEDVATGMTETFIKLVKEKFSSVKIEADGLIWRGDTDADEVYLAPDVLKRLSSDLTEDEIKNLLFNLINHKIISPEKIEKFIASEVINNKQKAKLTV